MSKIDNKDKTNLKLIYVLNVGETANKENIYEFIFSNNPTDINIKEWGWNESPACNNANPPDEDHFDHIVEMRLKDITLTCLHDAVDRQYLHGYYNIHALAYEDIFNDDNEYDDENDDDLLVFHYGISYQRIAEMFYSRDIKFE